MNRLPLKKIFNFSGLMFFVAVSLLALLGTSGEDIGVIFAEPKSEGVEAEASSPSPAVLGSESEGIMVTRIIDGDTIELNGGQKLRYIGIDTPETVAPGREVECFGREAAAKNAELVEGRVVTLEKDVNETDKYGRLLRYVYVDGVMVNEILVQEGYAESTPYPPDVKYQELLDDAENFARENSKGLWGGCE